MARLLHEIWIDAGGLETGLLAGPHGDDARRLLGAGARLVHTFWADSHLEAMTYYNRYLDREPYTSPYPDLDSTSYPEEWREVQERAGIAEP